MPTFELRNQETRNKLEYVQTGFKGLDRQAEHERAATLTLASCAQLLLHLFLFCCWRNSASNWMRSSLSVGHM